MDVSELPTAMVTPRSYVPSQQCATLLAQSGKHRHYTDSTAPMNCFSASQYLRENILTRLPTRGDQPE